MIKTKTELAKHLAQKIRKKMEKEGVKITEIPSSYPIKKTAIFELRKGTLLLKKLPEVIEWLQMEPLKYWIDD